MGGKEIMLSVLTGLILQQVSKSSCMQGLLVRSISFDMSTIFTKHNAHSAERGEGSLRTDREVNTFVDNLLQPDSHRSLI